MLRVWGKLYDRVRICRDYIASNTETDKAPEERFESCLEEIVRELDLPKPIFLPQNRAELENFRQT